MFAVFAAGKTDLKCNVLSFPVTIQPQNKPLMLLGLLSQVLLQLILILFTAALQSKLANLTMILLNKRKKLRIVLPYTDV